jgi:hypothetical protein
MNDGDNGHGEDGGKFLSRWSRLKRDARSAQPNGVGQAGQGAQADLSAAPVPLQQQEKAANSDSMLPQLPPLDELTLDSDYRGFFHPKVGEDVKRAALKKLFSDPHFNVMDGLDTYIDDYSISEPIPAEMLAQMRSAQKIFKWARNELEEGETAPAQLPSASTPAPDVSAPTVEAVPVIEQGSDEQVLQRHPDTVDATAPGTDE